MPEFIIAQIISIIAMALTVVSFQAKKNSLLLTVQIFSGACFAISFFLLKAYSAAALNVLGVLRCVLMITKIKDKWYTLALLELLFVVAGILTYGGWTTILIIVAQCWGTYCMWTGDGKFMRYGILCLTSPLWLIYNSIVFSLGGILCESFNIISILIALIRFKKTGFEK